VNDVTLLIFPSGLCDRNDTAPRSRDRQDRYGLAGCLLAKAKLSSGSISWTRGATACDRATGAARAAAWISGACREICRARTGRDEHLVVDGPP
jgi:hypothetical protein